MQNTRLQQCLKNLHNYTITGNCLLAELYRLSLITPIDFLNFQTSRFSNLLIDFSYFENRVSFDKFTRQTEEGRQLDENFFATFTPFLNSFARFFDQFYILLTDFIDFSLEYINSWNELFTRHKCIDELRMLSAQLLYILGLLLVLFDYKFPANIRERIFVSLYRLRMDFVPSKLELLVNICRNRREPFETCLATLGINGQFINQMLSFFRFYKGSRIGWIENALYICLYFEKDQQTLKSQFSIMRQLIDNYFTDRWILYFYIDLKVNLHEKWEGYKAANAALLNVRELWPITKLASSHLNVIQAPCFPSGLLSLEKFGDYIKMIYEFNSSLKWLILHSSQTANSKFNLTSQINKNDLLDALKRLAQFEFKFKQAEKYLRGNRDESIEKLKKRIVNNISQIIAFMPASSVSTDSSNSKKTARIVTWLESVRSSIDQLENNFSDNDKTIQLIENICSKISAVSFQHISSESFDKKQQNLILHHSLELANSDLRRLQNIFSLYRNNVDETTQEENTLCKLTDYFSTYLFLFVDEHCSLIEKLLRENPLSVRFIFLKLSAAVNGLFICGSENKIPELFSKKLSFFYYKVLEVKLRSVVQAIPRAIFDEMDQLNQYFSSDSQSVWVDKIRIEQFADLLRRRRLAELTYKISRLAMGIAQTCIKELGGDVHINSRALLSDGLCNELNKRLVTILSTDLSPATDTSSTSVYGLLERRRHLRLHQFRKTFLFVCEHVGLRNGIQIWAEQMHSVTKDYLTRKLAEDQMSSPTLGPSTAVLFSTLPEINIGRFFDFMLSVTRPNICIYDPAESIWRSVSDRKIKFSYNGFASLENWMLFGLSTLTGLILHNEITTFTQKLASKNFINTFLSNFQSTSITDISTLQKFFQQQRIPSTQFSIDGNAKEVLLSISKIGQLYILLANLHIFVDAEIKSQLGVVWRASSNFWSAIEIDNSDSPVPEFSEMLNFRSNELIDLLPKLAFVKSSKSIIFLLSIMLHFLQFGSTTISSNKRREFLDSFTVIQGCFLLLKENCSVWRNIPYLRFNRNSRIPNFLINK